ncbi:MAG: hypothetical protein J0J06_05045 [Sphingomonas sp.]|uniref:hypothetical protein n=1 Tax=Sphingomonas sp. TaxID=28214 RepID=UPI001AD385D2|nr:hypothetical protein [Sphingomonas sp.]MBN8814798.1 hypothetical protein [Sphingomonas sp.]MBN8850209.1 hypothetical protein [Sphingomonas sp.]
MSEQDKIDVAPTEAVAKAEAAATRRRWINLGEFVAVAGLLIAAVSLWMTWHDRKTDEADKQAEKQAEASDKARYEVKAVVADNNDLLIVRDDRHDLGDIQVVFPTALGVAPQTSSGQTISERWFKSALLKATDGGPDYQEGKLPVLLTVNYMDDDQQRSTTGVYDIVWRTKGGGLPLEGRSLKVIGLRLHERSGSQKRLDALWTVRPAG